MNKKILLSIVGTVLTVGILVAVDANKSVNFLSSNGFVIENALALAVECDNGQVTGLPDRFDCGTPYQGGSCTTKVVWCQGASGCCTPRKCSLHDN
jgi:uncharacterized membrane protein